MQKKTQDREKQQQRNVKNEFVKNFVSACCKFQSIFVVLKDDEGDSFAGKLSRHAYPQTNGNGQDAGSNRAIN